MKKVLYHCLENALTCLLVFLVFIKLFVARGNLSFGVFYSYFFYTLGFFPLWYLISEHERLYFQAFSQSREKNVYKYYFRNHILGIVYTICLVSILSLTNFIGAVITKDIIINIAIVFLFSVVVCFLVINLYHLFRCFLTSYLTRFVLVVIGFIATYQVMISNYTMPHMLINVLSLSRSYILGYTLYIFLFSILVMCVYLLLNRGESIYERT